MSTLTIAPADVHKDDLIVAIDGRKVDPPHRVLAPAREDGAVLLWSGHPTQEVQWWLYPASHVERDVTVQRSDPAPRKPSTRTVDGLHLTARGGAWVTDDGRYEIRKDEDNLTFCDAAHPVRLSLTLLAMYQSKPHLDGAQEALAADLEGKRGYLCPGGYEHAYVTWGVWDLARDDYAFDLSALDTFREAAEELAARLRA